VSQLRISFFLKQNDEARNHEGAWYDAFWIFDVIVSLFEASVPYRPMYQ
jgi:hypothetical protein